MALKKSFWLNIAINISIFILILLIASFNIVDAVSPNSRISDINIAQTPKLTIQSDLNVINQIKYSANMINWNVLNSTLTTQNSYVFVDNDASSSSQRFYRVLTFPNNNSNPHTIPSTMALIPAGNFTMGNFMASDSVGSYEPLHNVSVSAFYMDKMKVSLALWQQVRDWGTNNGYQWGGGISSEGNAAGDGPNYPVRQVSWYDAVKWANARSEMEGLTPSYYTDTAQTTVYRSGIIKLNISNVNWTANGYRLPTEAEREKAARGGLVGKRFPWGDTINHSLATYSTAGVNSIPYDLTPSAYQGNPKKPSPVDSFSPNGYGLYGMAGNVNEWCWDRYGSTYYHSSPNSDPKGPEVSSPTLSLRVARGGLWNMQSDSSRVSARSKFSQSGPSSYSGFRTVRSN